MNKLLSVIVFIAFSASSQVVQEKRFELPVTRETGDDLKVLPWNKYGALIFHRVQYPHTDVMTFTKLDTSLVEKWSTSINVTKDLTLAYSKTFGSKAYFLFKPRNYFGNFQLLVLGTDSATNLVYTIKNIIPFSPTMFDVANTTLVIAGYYNYRPVAIHFSLVSGQSKLLPGFFNDPGELNQLVINNDETVDVVINMKNSDRRRSLWIMNFSAEGNSIKNTIINPPADKNLIFGRMVNSGKDTSVIAGVYGRNGELSRGVFVGNINAAGEYTMRYYNFADLKNFFKYLRTARQNRIQERIERKKIRGKKVRFNYRIAVHEFIPYENDFLLLGEAFYPVYKSNSSYGWGRSVPVYYGNYYSPGSWQRDYTFDGYRYTHAVVIGIRKDGHLLWDNSFEIKNVKSFTLDQYVHAVQGKNLNLVYSFDDKLYSKIIEGTEVIEGKNEDQMRGNYVNDKIARHSTTNHKLEYWFDNHLLSYGVQEIKNNETANVPLTRTVFFINKIAFKD